MRSENEMYKLFLDIGSDDERIVAIYMNGSRTNINVPKDIFQDYDIVFVVGETKSFIEDKTWINKFGVVMYMQYPDEHPDYPSDKENFYGWLMQFYDGNRIDLHVETVEHALKNISKDKLCKVLLDKQGILKDIEPASDAQYFVKRPTQAQFTACCNEFWWCTNNLAKGLWREEIPYVQDMVNYVVRKQLEKMLSWKVGELTSYSVSVGKSAKYMKNWISKQEYEEYLLTYFDGRISNAWEAIFVMCELFSKTALWVSENMKYTYNYEEENVARAFLRHVNTLSKDAKEIY